MVLLTHWVLLYNVIADLKRIPERIVLVFPALKCFVDLNVTELTVTFSGLI